MFRLLLVIMFCFSVVVAADEKPKKGDLWAKLVQKFDGNRDKQISKDEYDKKCAGRWGELDINNDGIASEQELDKGLFKMPSKFKKRNPFFKRYDKNKDGKVTKSEGPKRFFAKKSFTRYFTRLDKNKDGVVTLSEAYNSRAKWACKIKAMIYKLYFKKLDKNKSGYLEKEEFKDGELFTLLDENKDSKVDKKEFSGAHVKKYLLKLDKNEDCKVSKEEFTTHNDKVFKYLDLNKDNNLTAKEVRNALKKYKKNKKNTKQDEKSDDTKVDDKQDEKSDDTKVDDKQDEKSDDDGDDDDDDESGEEEEEEDVDLEDALGEM